MNKYTCSLKGMGTSFRTQITQCPEIYIKLTQFEKNYGRKLSLAAVSKKQVKRVTKIILITTDVNYFSM